jgi:hypothetical protein
MVPFGEILKRAKSSSHRFVGNTGVEECEANCHERGLGERCLRFLHMIDND